MNRSMNPRVAALLEFNNHMHKATTTKKLWIVTMINVNLGIQENSLFFTLSPPCGDHQAVSYLVYVSLYRSICSAQTTSLPTPWSRILLVPTKHYLRLVYRPNKDGRIPSMATSYFLDPTHILS
jgi:hypothetical protein